MLFEQCLAVLRGFFIKRCDPQTLGKTTSALLFEQCLAALRGFSIKRCDPQDFALEPDEMRMRTAANYMMRNITCGLALITAREPILMQITNNLKNAFSSKFGVCLSAKFTWLLWVLFCCGWCCQKVSSFFLVFCSSLTCGTVFCSGDVLR